MEGSVKIHFPATLPDAAALLATLPHARILAGGTDLLVKHRNGMLPDLSDFVDVSGLGLYQIAREGDRIVIGSLCTMTTIAQNPIICTQFPALAQGASQVGAYQIRNAATIGGNVANASPAGDSIPPLFSLDAKLRIFGPGGHRTIPIVEFFTGPGKTTLQAGEIIEAFSLPDRMTSGVFIKLGERRAHAISKVSMALSCWEAGSGRREYRIALGAVGPTVLRSRRAEELLGATLWPPNADLIEKAKALVMETSRPIDDIRSVKDYRRKMTGVLLSRCLEQLTTGN